MRPIERLVCLGVLTSAGVLGAGCGRRPALAVAANAPPVVGVVRVQRRDLTRSIQLAAEFKPYQDVAVDAKVAGYVKTINVDVGDHVHKGELLAVLEVPELEDQLRQAQAAVAASQQSIARAQYLLAQAKAGYQDAHLDYTRLDTVIKTQPGLVAQQQVDDARSKDQAASAEVDATQAALAGAHEQLAEAEAERARVQTMFAYARITAPFDGVITDRYVDNGSMVQAGTTQAMPLVRLAEVDVLRLGIPVPESDVPRIHVGMPAQVQVTGLGQTFTGRVARFSDQVAFDTRTMYTEIDVPNPSGQLVPGMYVYATLDLDQRHGAVTVPVQALNRQPTQTTVLVVNPQHVLTSVTVQLGLETPNHAEVLRGLTPGEEVVVSGATLLHPGQAVEPRIVALPTAAGAS